MIVIRDYHGHRIEVAAARADGGRFNAVVHIRRTLSDAKPHISVRASMSGRLREYRRRFLDRSAVRKFTMTNAVRSA